MKKFLISWMLPFVLACGLIVIIRLFIVHIQIVDDSDMKNTLLKGEKVVCLKSKHFRRNSIVLVKSLNSNNSLKRLVAIPMDTLFVKGSDIFVNRIKMACNSYIAFPYLFSTDSINSTLKFMHEKRQEYDTTFASIGVFRFISNALELKKLESGTITFDIKKTVRDPALSEDENIIFNPALYWNKDNFGPLIVPCKGAKVRINKKLYFLYKQIIEQETGKKLKYQNNQVYLNNLHLNSYSFKNNYYFLMNDNWEHTNDSRTKGFVAEEQIIANFWFKIPW